MTFSDQSALSAHYDTAHAQGPKSERRFKCDVCGKRFTKKHNLKTHLSTVHSVGDVKTYKCDICSKVCSQKSNLKTHMKHVHKL